MPTLQDIGEDWWAVPTLRDIGEDCFGTGFPARFAEREERPVGSNDDRRYAIGVRAVFAANENVCLFQ